MPDRPTDPGHGPFELIPGLTIPTWKGINKQGSTAHPKDYELRDGKNIRPSGDGYRERGGQSKIITAPVGSIEGIYEFGDIGAPVAPILTGDPIVIVSAEGSGAFDFNHTLGEGIKAQDGTLYALLNDINDLQDFLKVVRIDQSAVGPRVYIVCYDSSVPEMHVDSFGYIPVTGTADLTLLHTQTVAHAFAEYRIFCSMAQITTGTIFILRCGINVNEAIVYIYDPVGGTFTADYTISGVAAFRGWLQADGDALVYAQGVHNSDGELFPRVHYRNSSGVWSTPAMPVYGKLDATYGFRTSSHVRHGSDVFLGGSVHPFADPGNLTALQPNILKVSGGVVTVYLDIWVAKGHASGEHSRLTVTSMASASNLYYTYSYFDHSISADPSTNEQYQFWIGKDSNPEWVDLTAAMQAVWGSTFTASIPVFKLVAYDGVLYAFTAKNTAGALNGTVIFGVDMATGGITTLTDYQAHPTHRAYLLDGPFYETPHAYADVVLS